MSNPSRNLESPPDLDPTDLEEIDFSSEYWEDRMANIMREVENDHTSDQLGYQDNELPTYEESTAAERSDAPSTGQTIDEHQSDQARISDTDMNYTIIAVWADNEIVQVGPRKWETQAVHITGPGTYASMPETNPAEDVGIDTIEPTDDEEQIEHWKLIPRSALIQYGRYWASFRCKLHEYTSRPMDFVRVEHAESRVNECKMVTECKIESIGQDDNENELLRAEMIIGTGVTMAKYELWCKKIVGNEEPILTDDERQYIWYEEQKTF